MNVNDQGPLSEASKGLTFGQMIRDYDPMEGVKWRFGKPNYERVNKLYFENRSKNHAEGSLEMVVQTIVKNWEVESHHIADPAQWKTMDVTKFKAQVNGGCPVDAQFMADVGPYNLLLGESKEYSAGQHSFNSTNTLFGGAFADGYALEILEVYSGPPVVTCKWRHFGKFSGTFTDKMGQKYKGDGRVLDLVGFMTANVNAELKIELLDIYYNPHDILTPLTAAEKIA